jgi:hypothetical protein
MGELGLIRRRMIRRRLKKFDVQSGQDEKEKALPNISFQTSEGKRAVIFENLLKSSLLTVKICVMLWTFIAATYRAS